MVAIEDVQSAKNSTVVFPAPMMSTIGELGAILARENVAAGALQPDEVVIDLAGAVPHGHAAPVRS